MFLSGYPLPSPPASPNEEFIDGHSFHSCSAIVLAPAVQDGEPDRQEDRRAAITIMRIPGYPGGGTRGRMALLVVARKEGSNELTRKKEGSISIFI